MLIYRLFCNILYFFGMLFTLSAVQPSASFLGTWNDPCCRGYDASIFDTWFLRVQFDKDNIPTYTFFEPPAGSSWQQMSSSVYYLDGTPYDNTVSTGIPLPEFITMKNVSVYVYRGVNPLLQQQEQNRTYPAGILDRFRFYQFTGDAKVLGIGVSLDNYLIAVDTWSKFVFAYGEITAVKKSFGQMVPQQYTAVEKSSLHSGVRPFYEYDPIGYVNADGTVVLYTEYKDRVKENGAVHYFPVIYDTGRAAAGYEPNAAGCSPYLLYIAQN